MYNKTGKKMGRPVGYKMSSETKAKIAYSHMGLKHTNETKEKMSKAKLGIPKTEEHKQHIRETNMGNRLMKFPNGEAHRVYAKTFEDFLGEAQEKNWWLDANELKTLWEELEQKRTEK